MLNPQAAKLMWTPYASQKKILCSGNFYLSQLVDKLENNSSSIVNNSNDNNNNNNNNK